MPALPGAASSFIQVCDSVAARRSAICFHWIPNGYVKRRKGVANGHSCPWVGVDMELCVIRFPSN